MPKRSTSHIQCVLWRLVLFAITAPALWSYSTGPDPFKTGGPFPGESTCAEAGCHSQGGAGLNKGPGSVTITVSPYTPGQSQTITVTIADPTKQRWGFELTARQANSLLVSAGAFQPVDSNTQVICGNPSNPSVPPPFLITPPCPSGWIPFAEHTLTGTRLGTRNGVTFQVSWTPPSSGAGDIIFAAAGNAANGDSNNTGDNIYTTSVKVSAAEPSCPGGLGGSPTIGDGGIVGGGLSSPLVKTISPNGLISIFGLNFAPPGTLRSVSGADLVNGSLPTNLACTCVNINNQPAPMFFVSPGQVNVQVPSLSGTGSMAVQVLAECGATDQATSNSQSIVVQAVAPEFFFFQHNASGGSPVAAANAITGALVGAKTLFPGKTNPAKPGDFVALYATGLGMTNPAFAAGALPDKIASTTATLSVSLNGVTLALSDVLYAGVAPSFAGLYQINIHIPTNMPNGDLPVSANINGVSTPPGAFITVQN